MGLYTNTMRYTGMSGIDTESMVQQLMKAEGMKFTKLSQQRQLLQWKQDAYRGVADKMSGFQKQFLDFSNAATNIRSTSTFLNFKFEGKVSGQASTAAKVTAGKDAKAGTYKLDIEELASGDTYTTSVQNSNAKGTSAVNYENLKNGGAFNLQLDNGSAKTITFSKDEMDVIRASSDKNAAMKQKLNDKLAEAFGEEPGAGGALTAKITADIGTDGRISFKPKDGHSINLTNATPRTSELTGSLMDLEDSNNIFRTMAEGTTSTFKVNIDGVDNTVTFTAPKLTAGTDGKYNTKENYDKIAEAINKGLSDKGLRTKVAAGTTTDTDGKLRIKFASNNTDSDVKLSNGIMNDLGITGSNATMQSTNVLSDFGFKNGTSSKMSMTKTVNEIFNISGAQTLSINGKTISYNGTDDLTTFMKNINESGAGVSFSYNTSTEKFELKSSSTGVENKIKFGTDSTGTGAGSLLSQIKSAQPEVAKDAKINMTVNGETKTYYRSTNNFELEGLTVQLNEKTQSGSPLTITAERDTSNTMDVVKKFVDAYNSLITGLQDEYSTGRSKKSKYQGYEPLTDEEKMNMSDKAIESYEAKAKVGMLYRDNTVSEISSSMRSMMYESVKMTDGRSISLYEIGITTSANTGDGGKLIIDEDKLKKALSERGDEVSQLFTKGSNYLASDSKNYQNRLKEEGLAERLNDIVNKATSTTSGTITNKAGIKGGSSETQNDLYKQLRAMDDKLYDMGQYLVDKENSYYSMFSKMESSVSQNNSQMAALQSMFR